MFAVRGDDFEDESGREGDALLSEVPETSCFGYFVVRFSSPREQDVKSSSLAGFESA